MLLFGYAIALREGQPKIRRMLAEKQGKMAAAATTQASSSVASSLPSQAPSSLAASARYQQPASAATSMAASSMSHAASARPFADFSTESLVRAALANSLSNSLSYCQYNPLFAPPPPPQPQERLPVQPQERAQEERQAEEEGVGSNPLRSNKERRHSQVTPPPQAQAPPQAPQASLPAMPNYMQSLDTDLLLIALLRRANGR